MKIKLAVIADDFTGALDTGIKFSESGVCTKVLLCEKIPFSEIEDDVEVLVIDSETRHLKPSEAYRIIFSLVKSCLEFGIDYIYKKTDSALRGCVGSELAAVVDASGCDVQFIPALPNENRITKKGIHYINEVPVADSLFGSDLFEPVTHSYIPDIIREQTETKTIVVEKDGSVPQTNSASIIVYDASTYEDILKIAKSLTVTGALRIMAGCSGFACCLPEMLKLTKGKTKKEKTTRSLFVESGSINLITEKQILYAEEHGFTRVTLDDYQKLKPDYFNTPEGINFMESFKEKCQNSAPVILDVFTETGTKGTMKYCEKNNIKKEDLRNKIAERMGEFGAKWLSFDTEDTIAITGGDTVYAFLKQINCKEIEPICEISSGAVLFNVEVSGKTIQVISKSGGLGDIDIFTKILNQIEHGK